MNFQEKLAGVVSRYEEVQSLLASPSIGADELVKLNKEISVLEPVVEAIHNYQKQEKSFKEAGELMPQWIRKCASWQKRNITN